jgi:RNA polymerase sigma-70 factor, ECF subfamily
MPTHPRRSKDSAARSPRTHPMAEAPLEQAQLYEPKRVHSNVSSVAIDRGLLAVQGASGASNLGVGCVAPGEGMSDAEVMLRVKAGDDSAFEYLVQKYRRAMMTFMYRMVRNAAVAEDLAQEVFLRVYRSRESYEPSAKFTTWLYRIATNLGVNYARDTRHERPENVVHLDETDEQTKLSFNLADGSLTAEERIMRRERMAAIRQRVQALPERQRMAVILHKYQQMDYRQIAETLKLSESATKSLLFRAYETLRAQLKEFL